MDAREKEIEKLKDYKYGFSTDIENTRAPKGLNEDTIKFISNLLSLSNSLTSLKNTFSIYISTNLS